MLAHQPYSRRHSTDSSFQPPSTTTTTNLHPTDLSTLAISSPAPTNPRDDLVEVDWQSSTASPSFPEPRHIPDYYYMPSVASENPPIRVYHSTPGPESAHYVGENGFYNSSLEYQPQWGFPEDNKAFTDSHASSSLHPSLQQHLRQAAHKRNSSASTIASAGPSSPYTPASSSPRIVDSDSIYCPSPGSDLYEYGQYPSYQYPKQIAKPTQRSFQLRAHTPTHLDYPRPTPHDERRQLGPEIAMAQAPAIQQNSESGGPTLVTSKRSNGVDDLEDNAKAMKEPRGIIPKFDRTMSDIYQDELYNPDAPTSTPSSQARTSQSALLSPYRGVFSERLQAANDMRSSSPAQALSRKSSPFRQGFESVARQHLNGDQPATRLSSAAQMREQQKADADVVALKQHQKPKASDLDAPSTISPKEAMLDFKDPGDESDQPLASGRSRNSPTGMQVGQDYSSPLRQSTPKRRSAQGSSLTGQRQLANTRRESSSEFSMTSPPPSQATFASASAQIPLQYPFIPQLSTQSSNMTALSNRDPEFPAPLISMESTKSDTTSRSQSGRYESGSEVQQRPLHTTADTGTYSCPYNGCLMRFTTAARLQKHKRESHRQSTPQSAYTTTNGGNSPQESAQHSSASGSSNTINRNSQAGPHQCRQVNPTTGKPCNSVFSRPYDLTRHEDTIHNVRKQKVRCNLCSEEKTFSRNDALTRHMRVVHPEVDFPGKNRRRGGK